MLILIAENIYKAEETNKTFSIKFSRFSHRLKMFLCVRENFQIFFLLDFKFDGKKVDLGLNRCEKKLSSFSNDWEIMEIQRTLQILSAGANGESLQFSAPKWINQILFSCLLSVKRAF